MELVKILFFALHLFPTIHAGNDCRPSSCGDNPFQVRFPFQLLQQQPRNNCGYPGFDLSCTGKNPKVVLTLPRSGDFNVRNIDYLAQEIQLYDPDNCMPGRLLSFNLSSSSSLLPFAPVYSQNFSFLRCPSETVKNRFVTIDCLSTSTWSVIATASTSFARSMNTCSSIATLPVPVSWPPQNSDWLTSDLSGDLRLTWNDPNCEGCEARGGTCGFANSTSDRVFCFDDQGRGGSHGMLIFKIIALSIVVPAVTCSICISCFLFVVKRRRNDTHRRDSDIAPPLPDSSTTGLDDSTIESYAKVVLGESKRLSGPNGTTCPICLVDYFPRDTIRSIPMCNHCFHLDCIDEWLRINGTCPVCRYSPSPSPQAN